MLTSVVGSVDYWHIRGYLSCRLRYNIGFSNMCITRLSIIVHKLENCASLEHVYACKSEQCSHQWLEELNAGRIVDISAGSQGTMHCIAMLIF